MFLLNSWQGQFAATSVSVNQQRPSFSRSYGGILPSSLTRVLPIPLVYSTHLPESVCGTVTLVSTLRRFSRQLGSITLAQLSFGIMLQIPGTDFPIPINTLDICARHVQLDGTDLPYCVPPSLHQSGSGILTRYPSPTPFGLG